MKLRSHTDEADAILWGSPLAPFIAMPFVALGLAAYVCIGIPIAGFILGWDCMRGLVMGTNGTAEQANGRR